MPPSDYEQIRVHMVYDIKPDAMFVQEEI